ncbi:class I SAM-dependent methyltransferase [Sinorhizobium fredii]|uniref:class I SAM-dependent methyltransferase n=1 Tax=Rhizobium fredii TaxID=380 RepID=UPI002958B21D|nr:methyltransferase domain-containing protein [Sinorhizobium fredii]WOS65922.1 methyltransferase domain-containing protein [Sinorhizobium fredii GR64]
MTSVLMARTFALSPNNDRVAFSWRIIMTLPSYAMNQASFPEMYERWLVGPLFRPWAEMTLEELALSPGDRVLDIACGTGIAARVARERLGHAAYVVGIDISPDMLAVARAVEPAIDWREGNASALPLRDGEQFDVVVCQQGLQFFPDKPAAAAQMRGALAKGGRLALATWRPDDEIPFFRELRRVAERHLGAIVDQRYSLGDAAPLEALLRDAGFHEVRSRIVSRTIRFGEGAPFLRLNTMALVGMSSLAKEMGNQERKRIVNEIVSESASALQPYSDGSGLAFELSTNLATAKG